MTETSADDPACDRSHVPADQVVDDAVGDGDDAADRALVDVEDVDQDALPAQEAGQRHDEGGDLEAGDQRALEGADDETGGHAHQNPRPPRPVLRRADQRHGNGGADGTDEADGEVDLAQEERVELGQAEENDEGGLNEEVDDVGRRQECARLHLEEDADDDQADDDRQRAALAALYPPPPCFEVVAEGVGQDVRREDYELLFVHRIGGRRTGGRLGSEGAHA
jgi:hypothetical protein